MRAMWCGFALGVIVLQRQAALPGWGAWVALVLATVLGATWAAWALRGAAPVDESHVGLSCGRRWRMASGWAAVWFAAACAGFGYAAWRAETRLAEALPAAWQARNIAISGYISSLPSYGANGASFLFRVESWETHKAATALPHLIQLSWVAREAPLPPLVPGARWRLAVRLKRPHGKA
ncbi:DUF4131 domain-containing protein, partial [Paraburkholderia sp. BR14319]|uniref:DUF4131 domain-containing protein n=1 Tax=Paraburkholderia sp. BR14319 TaxID=3237005 RepID=UPI0034D16F5D